MAYTVKSRDGEPIKHEGKEVKGSDFMGAIKSVNVDRRTLTIIASDETVDRDGDIIRVSGWDFENYKKNPVFIWAHDYSSVPLAAAYKIVRRRNPKQLVLSHKFPDEGINPFADMIFNLYEQRVINAGSVGFFPKKWKRIEQGEPVEGEYRPWMPTEYLKQELLEHSGCAVPANPSAIQEAVKGLKSFGSDFQETMTKYLLGEDKLELEEQVVKDAKEAFEEIISRGLEFVEDEGKTLVQVVDDLEPNKEVSGKGNSQETPDEPGETKDNKSDEEPEDVPHPDPRFKSVDEAIVFLNDEKNFGGFPQAKQMVKWFEELKELRRTVKDFYERGGDGPTLTVAEIGKLAEASKLISKVVERSSQKDDDAVPEDESINETEDDLYDNILNQEETKEAKLEPKVEKLDPRYDKLVDCVRILKTKADELNGFISNRR